MNKIVSIFVLMLAGTSFSISADTLVDTSFSISGDTSVGKLIEHSGRTDRYGCHNDYKRGTYHCH